MTNPAQNFSIITQFVTIACSECGILFGVDARVRQRWVDDGALHFHCPNGHSQHYTESTVSKLRKQLEQERKALEDQKRQTQFAKDNATAERAAREHTERQLRSRKGINTRLRMRIKHGVCPCCHRTVSQLARHMKTKHPHFAANDGET